MKRILIYSVLVALFCLPASILSAHNTKDHSPFKEAEQEVGIFLGGSFSYWKSSNSGSNLVVAPEFGYHINDDWAVGTNLAYKSDAAMNIAGISPFVRYYYLHRGPFNLYCDAGAALNAYSAANASNKSFGYEVGLRPGVCIDLSRGFCLCVRMSFIGYRNNYFLGEEEGLGSNGFAFRFAPEDAKIGIELEF